jgi:hypothetical protein
MSDASSVDVEINVGGEAEQHRMNGEGAGDF